jgi:hypothetical protein
VRDENSVSWNMKEGTGYLIVFGGGCFFKFLWRNVFHAERMLQLIELGVNAHGRIQDFEMASWRLDLSFDNEPSASSTNFGDKAALPFALRRPIANMYGEDGNKRRSGGWHVVLTNLEHTCINAACSNTAGRIDASSNRPLRKRTKLYQRQFEPWKSFPGFKAHKR